MVVNRWRGLVVAFALVAGLLFVPTAGNAQASQSPIAAKALTYVGTHGGQCWTFMQRVVLESTGKHVIGDYRQAYLNAGAVEVSASEAASGDIIQIASDSNTSAWASYPGLHTAIILENLGGGIFNAVDSNQNWDEMVALRPNYDPYSAASRYGLQVHIYRIDGSAPAATVSLPAPELAAGNTATVNTGGDCLNLRTSASTSASKLGCLPAGTALTVIAANTEAGGREWVQVQTPLGEGWVAAEYLAAAAPAPAAAAAAPAPEPAPAVAAAAAPSARVDNSPGCLRLRDAAGLGGTQLACLDAGTPVTFGDAERVTLDGYEWARVTAAGQTGWVAAKYLIEP